MNIDEIRNFKLFLFSMFDQSLQINVQNKKHVTSINFFMNLK